MNARELRNRGSVLLVVMCFAAVLGIGVAGYIALCSRAMQLSNRSVQAGLSKQIAETGIEEALRALNKNDWSGWTSGGVTVTWSDNGTTGKKATISFPSSKFGQGVTASAKIRIDNVNTNLASVTWNSSTNYRIGDLVGYNGIWYRSVRDNNQGQTPSTTSLTWWVQTPMPWLWRKSAPYAQYDLVNYEGIWYRCIAAHTSNASTFASDSSYWTSIPTLRNWASGTAYSVYDAIIYTDPTSGDVSLYRCTTAHTSSANFTTDAANWSSNVQTLSLAWSSGAVYTRGAIVYNIGSSNYCWYYCKVPGISTTAPQSDTTMWTPLYSDASSATPIDTLVASTVYYPGDYAYRTATSTWYRCTTTHTYGSWAADSGNWTTTNAIPYFHLIYRGASSQVPNNIIFYAGSTWYRYMGGWNVATTGTMQVWTSGYKYNPGDVVYYSTTAKWYRCVLAHTASSTINPSSTTYWATGPVHSTTWSSTRQYSQYDTVRHNGVWYLSLQNSNIGQNPSTATSYWVGANTTTSSYKWNSTTAYTAGEYKCYGGVWYKCSTGNTGISPNDTSAWTASWANSWNVTTGAPVIYAESSVAISGNPTIKTQLRATVAPAPLFPNAVAANSSTITANSGGTVDSYDSTLGTYASQVGTATNYSAVVASTYSGGTAVTLTSTDVKGYLAVPSSSTSPYSPLYSTGGTVQGQTSPLSPNVDVSRISRTPYVPKFDTLPSGGLSTNWSTTPKGTALSLSTTTNIGTPGDTIPSRYYYNGTLTVGTGSLTTLRINGPVILYINGDLNITASGSTGRVEMSSTGSAEIHITGAFKADSGGEGIVSYNYDPKSLIIISDTTSTANHYYSEGVYPLYGVVYIPSSTSTTGYYNDNNSTVIYGAISANKITYSGANLNVHYDTALRYTTFGGVDQPYAVTEWRELTDPTELATMP